MKKAKTPKSKKLKIENTEIVVVPKGKSVISRERKAALKAKPRDELSTELEQAQLGMGLESVAIENGVDFRWAHLNKGMQRMNLGNRLRGMLNRGERVVVEGRTIHATPVAIAA